ncbi:hypothetical protein EYS09_24740 [Streptomyces kasugaensis]|uniref:Ricin B lectin domain-containing protein n=2 Tax=Streptomyces kasugaensis TaxID=1946 RepID=A0A4Q9HS99_STRKA|nr:hypothetical protein EYS09_24740 [Streptomyces kasugaensis]
MRCGRGADEARDEVRTRGSAGARMEQERDPRSREVAIGCVPSAEAGPYASGKRGEIPPSGKGLHMRSALKKWGRALAVVTVTMSATAVVPGGSAAAANGVQIRTFADKCFDVQGQTTADDAHIVQYRCDSLANQRFRIVPLEHGEFEIRTFANKCLDVQGQSTADDTRIVQYTCSGLFNQRFRIVDIGRDAVEIRTFADKCFDVKGQSAADEVRIVQYRCDGLFNQRFTIL